MKIRNQLPLAVACLVSILFVGSGRAFALTLHEVPSAVRITIEKEAKGGKVGEVAREGEGKSATFSTVVETGGKSYAIVVADQGKLLSKKLVGETLNVKEKGKKEKKEGDKKSDSPPAKGGKKGGTSGSTGSSDGKLESSAKSK